VILTAAALLAACSNSGPATPPPNGGPTPGPGATATAPVPTVIPSPTGAIPASFPLAVVTGLENNRAVITMDDLETLASTGKLTMPCDIGSPQLPMATQDGCVAPDAIAGTIQDNPKLIALLPVGLVEPATKVLAFAGDGPYGFFGPDLFGGPEARALAYPLTGAALPGAGFPAGWVTPDAELGQIWTLNETGSLCADRGGAKQAVTLGKGWDWVFDGGTARYNGPPIPNPKPPKGIDRHPIVRPVETGHDGVTSQLIRSADLTLGNLKCPVLPTKDWHPANQNLGLSVPEDVLSRWDSFLGIDAVYLPADHQSDRGVRGIRATLELLKKHGFPGTGLGLNLDQALEPAYVDVAGQKVAFVSWDNVPGPTHAGATTAGVAWLTKSNVDAAVKRAKDGGADLIVCDPQWWAAGSEYRRRRAACLGRHVPAVHAGRRQRRECRPRQLPVRPGFLAEHPGRGRRLAGLPGRHARQRAAVSVRDDPRSARRAARSGRRRPLRPRSDLVVLRARLPEVGDRVQPADVAAIVDRQVASGAFAGAALVVLRGDTPVIRHFAGFAGPDLAADATVLWPLASITKLYTASAVMRLVELGEVTVNTPVCHVLPRFHGDGREAIRIRHLLTHTSGLPYESTEMDARLAAHTPVEGLIDEALDAPLLFRPGTRFAYSDYAYGLAGRVAEVITGHAFPELVRRLILQPMGLEDTFMAPFDGGGERIATVRGVFNDGTDGAMYNSAYGRTLAHPAFSAVAGVDDVVTFLRHFAPGGPRVLSEATVRAMTSSQTGGVPGTYLLLDGFPEDTRYPWGFGFCLQRPSTPAVFSELASFETFGHPGASGCQILVDPVAGLTIVLLTNTHILTGRDAWLRRQQEIVNACFAGTPAVPAAPVGATRATSPA
jgi:CubicO group peptidase (beta-lactamase class C family)